MVELGLYVCVFLSVALLFIGAYSLAVAPRADVLDRLKLQTMPVDEMKKTVADRSKGLRSDVLGFLGILGKKFLRRSYLSGLQQKLVQAHIFMRAEEFIGLAVVCGLGAFFLLWLATGTIFVALIAAFIAARMPDIFISAKRTKRMNKLNDQLPEALSIIANGLRAGHSFPQAMAVVSREMEAPIGQEFGRVVRENRLGKPMDDVLRDMTERTDSEDLDMVVTVLLIQRVVGGNLAEILNKIEHTIRERVRIRGEIKTLTAQQKMSAVIIILLPIAVAAILTIANPEYMLALFRETAGLIMLSAAIFLQVIGVMVIRKIINIEI